MANEFNIQNGFISNNNSTIIGNLNVTGGTQSIFSGNSSTELVRITQTGSGDAFVVEDSSNVDNSHFVINASGDTAIGLTQPIGGDKLTVSGNTTVYGILSGTTATTSTMYIVTSPTTSYTNTEILVRNSTTGQIEKTDSTSSGLYNFGMTYAMTNFIYLT